jgi:hypothetical protein
MGGTESKAAVSSVSSAISNVVMSTVQSCEVAATQDQNLTVVNSGIRFWGSYTLEQKSEIRADCFSDVKKQTELQNNIINTISQAVSSSNIALLGAFGSTTAIATTNLTNIVRNNVSMSNIQQSYNAIKQKQTASFTNSGVIGFEQVELTQGAKIFAAATLQEVDKAGIFNTISSFVDQKTTAKTENPLDFIAKAIGAIGDTVMSYAYVFIFLIIAIIVGVIALPRIFPAAPVRSGTSSGTGGALGLASKLPLPPQLKVATLAAGAVSR